MDFSPAFLDTETRTVYRSRFFDGRPAPCHLLEGLPPAVVGKRSLVCGFLRKGRFYTRAQAAAALAGCTIA